MVWAPAMGMRGGGPGCQYCAVSPLPAFATRAWPRWRVPGAALAAVLAAHALLLGLRA